MRDTVILPEEEILSALGRRWSTMLVHLIRSHFPHQIPENVEVLDIKTGAGFMAGLMGKYGYQVTGVDRSEDDLALASEKTGHYRHRITLWKMKVEDMFFPDESFDVIISRDLAGKELDMSVAFEEWKRVLKPGGMVLSFEADMNLAQSVADQAVGKDFFCEIDFGMERFFNYKPGRQPHFQHSVCLIRSIKK